MQTRRSLLSTAPSSKLATGSGAHRRPCRVFSQLSVRAHGTRASHRSHLHCSSTTAGTEAPSSTSTVGPVYDLKKWKWRGNTISYQTAGCGMPIVLIHGFGMSSRHWRYNMPELAKQYKVYAIDLLGFGASEKPVQQYQMEVWAELVEDFLSEFVQQPAVLMGNSIGSLVCLMVAAAKPEQVSGVVLVNCAGGMNNKAIADDWRIKLAMPIFLAIDWLLQQPSIAQRLFDNFRQPDNIRNVFLNVYQSSKDNVDDELVDMVHGPSNDEGALEAFVSCITGPPGPRPEQLLPDISAPVLLLWGDKDTFTPMDGPVGRYFQALPETRPNSSFIILPGLGHCPHDENPGAVHEKLLPWLQENLQEAACREAAA